MKARKNKQSKNLKGSKEKDRNSLCNNDGNRERRAATSGFYSPKVAASIFLFLEVKRNINIIYIKKY